MRTAWQRGHTALQQLSASTAWLRAAQRRRLACRGLHPHRGQRPPCTPNRPFIEECLAKMLLFERLESAGQKRVVQEMYRCAGRAATSCAWRPEPGAPAPRRLRRAAAIGSAAARGAASGEGGRARPPTGAPSAPARPLLQPTHCRGRDPDSGGRHGCAGRWALALAALAAAAACAVSVLTRCPSRRAALRPCLPVL